MDLKKQLVTYYVIATDLEQAKLQSQGLAKTIAKFRKNDTPQLADIQERIDGFLSYAAAKKSILKLTKQQKRREAKLVSILKEINFPQGKKIEINDEHYGKFTFWYKGSKILFQKEIYQSSLSA